MSGTPNLNLPTMPQNPAAPDVVFNLAMSRIDAAFQNAMPGTSASIAGPTVSLNGGYNGITNTHAGVLVANLPVSPVAGDVITVKDEAGNAGDDTHAIRVTPPSGTIEGLPYIEINVNYGYVKLRHNGTAWFSVPG